MKFSGRPAVDQEVLGVGSSSTHDGPQINAVESLADKLVTAEERYAAKRTELDMLDEFVALQPI